MADDPKTIRGRVIDNTQPPDMPTAANAVIATGPPPMPDTEPVMATLVGDSRTNADGGVLAPPSMPPSRYVIGAEIARGGMGRVVEATDTYLGRVVALKEALATDAESLERFARETRITARLEHPSIVPVHDGGKGPNGMPYYVMRKIEGVPLEKLVMQASSLNERLVLIRHMVASAEAIAHAHERGIVHRDIKPSNILVGELGETIVIDWGLAKVIGEADEPSEILGVKLQPVAEGDTIKTRAGIVFGTPGFMAPEQLRGGPVDPRWDVYALGATLYHVLSKKPPHYAKTADEMMQRAVNAPPQSIGELVQGVPPELSTIIDKALAFDPDKRYQDARELAADLQRFEGGQLVASHHYTTRERVSRYVLKHRVAFLVGAVAAATMMIGGAVAFVRIVNERDRADRNAGEARKAQKLAEQEKAIAEQRAEDLALTSARSVASTNPTYAIALVKPLAHKRWREVRAIAAEARAAGVAWSVAVSPSTQSLQMSRDGKRVLVAGEDGVVRLVDLEARSTKTLVETGSAINAVFAADETKVVVWSGLHIGVVDIKTGAKNQREVEIPIVGLEVVGTTLYWNDGNGALWQMAIDGAAPLQIEMPEAIALVRPSPDGNWLALGGVDHFYLYDRTKPTSGALEIVNGDTHAIDWAKDSSHVGILHDQEAIDVTLEHERPGVWHRLTVGERSHVVQGKSALFTIGPTGVGMVSASQSRPRKQLTKPIGLEESRGDAVIAGGEEQLVVLTDHGDHVLAAPNGRFTMVRASPESPFVVATMEERLLVWNLDEIEPRVIADQASAGMFVTADDLIATFVDGPAKWIDLRTGTAREIGAMPPLLEAEAAPGGQTAVVLDVAHRAHVLGTERVTIGSADHVAFATDAQLVLSTNAGQGGQAGGQIDSYDIASKQRTKLFAYDAAPMTSIAVRGTNVAAQFADGLVWRTDLVSKATQTVTARAPSSNVRIAGGDVFVLNGTEILRWPAGAPALVHHANLPRKITRLGAMGDSLVAFADDGAAFLVDAKVVDRVTDLEVTLGRNSAAMHTTSPMIAVLDRGAIDILDPAIKPPRWRLAAAAGTAYAGIQISPGGRRVLARTGSTLLVWDLSLPDTADAVAAWLDQMTNAVAGSGAKSLGWR